MSSEDCGRYRRDKIVFDVERHGMVGLSVGATVMLFLAAWDTRGSRPRW